MVYVPTPIKQTEKIRQHTRLVIPDNWISGLSDKLLCSDNQTAKQFVC